MIGHKLPNKNEKCYSSRTQTFSPTKQPLCGLWGRPLRCCEAMRQCPRTWAPTCPWPRDPAGRWPSRATSPVRHIRLACQKRWTYWKVGTQDAAPRGDHWQRQKAESLRAASLWTRTTVHGRVCPDDVGRVSTASELRPCHPHPAASSCCSPEPAGVYYFVSTRNRSCQRDARWGDGTLHCSC
jgi:hypothetical protein